MTFCVCNCGSSWVGQSSLPSLTSQVSATNRQPGDWRSTTTTVGQVIAAAS